MSKKTHNYPSRKIKIYVQFWIDGKDMTRESPSGKVFLESALFLGKDGEKNFKSTLERFFGKVSVMVIDLAKKLNSQTKDQN